MIAPEHTTLDWQLHRTDIVVLPVGSLEQHGTHLPLNTDAVIAEYLGRLVAEHFCGALLPVLPISNSLEHSGFRGSFSIRPETLMQMFRDIAEEAEKQHFRFMIVINGHGGNFALGPVIRDWNRQDRPLKILLQHGFEGADTSGLEQPARGWLDIHAGERETSIYMHVSGRHNLPCPEQSAGITPPFVQADLNTFGAGVLSASGALGHPEYASAEKGAQLCQSALPALLEKLSQRMDQLRRTPAYCGAGGLVLRPVTVADIGACLDLLRGQGWNQVQPDLALFVEQGTLLSTLHNGRIVATGAIISWDDQLAWIGMVLTLPEMRGRSIATTLMQEMLQRYRQVRSIKLDASIMGAPIYRRLGFIEEQRIIRFSVPNRPALPSAFVLQWEPLSVGNVAEAMAMEEVFTGMRRDSLWQYYLRCHPHLAWLGRDATRRGVACFCGRPGRLFHQIGPLCAENPSQAAAALLHFAQQIPFTPLQLDVPETQTDWIDLLAQAGFRRERDFLRMHYGEPCGDWNDRKVYAIFGPEMG